MFRVCLRIFVFFTIGSDDILWPKMSYPVFRILMEDSSYQSCYFSKIVSDLYDQEKPDVFLALDHSSNRDFLPGAACSKQPGFLAVFQK